MAQLDKISAEDGDILVINASVENLSAEGIDKVIKNLNKSARQIKKFYKQKNKDVLVITNFYNN